MDHFIIAPSTRFENYVREYDQVQMIDTGLLQIKNVRVKKWDHIEWKEKLAGSTKLL